MKMDASVDTTASTTEVIAQVALAAARASGVPDMEVWDGDGCRWAGGRSNASVASNSSSPKEQLEILTHMPIEAEWPHHFPAGQTDLSLERSQVGQRAGSQELPED